MTFKDDVHPTNKKPRHRGRGSESAGMYQLLFERGGNAAERGVQVRTERLYDRNDRDRDASGDEAVFDGGRGRIISDESGNGLCH
jgi:hypothetical protein